MVCSSTKVDPPEIEGVWTTSLLIATTGVSLSQLEGPDVGLEFWYALRDDGCGCGTQGKLGRAVIVCGRGEEAVDEVERERRGREACGDDR
jgi:hypothetical protein